MFEFLNKPPVFSTDYHIMDCPDWALAQSIKPGNQLKLINTTIFYKKSTIGDIKATFVDYIKRLIPDAKISVTLKSNNPLFVTVSASGTLPEAPAVNTAPGAKNKEYTYKTVVQNAYPVMIPSVEYPCTLEEADDGYLIIVNREIVGEIKDIGDKKRVATLSRMLSGNDCKLTSQLEIDGSRADLYVIVRF